MAQFTSSKYIGTQPGRTDTGMFGLDDIIDGFNDFPDAQVLLRSQTASGSGSLSFDTNLTSSYAVYMFQFINIHPASDNQNFTFIRNTGNVQSAATNSRHNEADSVADNFSDDALEGKNSTGAQILAQSCGNDNDDAINGFMYLFNPSNTTHLKHFFANITENYESDAIQTNDIGGYLNTTSAVTSITFQFASGNIDTGTIKLFGLRESVK